MGNALISVSQSNCDAKKGGKNRSSDHLLMAQKKKFKKNKKSMAFCFRVAYNQHRC
jgi:hypothetical protein